MLPSRETLAARRVLVVGDVMLDRYWHGAVERISPEAPVPVVRVQREEERLGGAANVALNARTLGANTTLLTVVGQDEPARRLRELLHEHGIATVLRDDKQLYTIVKLRVIGRAQQLIRIDFENEPDHEVLGQMLVDLSVEGLKARGVDPDKDPVKYCWHYSQATVTDQNSWQVEGEKIIKEKYPNWENVQPDNYYSEQDAEKSVTIGKAVLAAHADIDLIICNDSTALPGQLEAAQQAGLTKDDVTITGFATPNAIKPYCTANILHNWGLWDCKVQGALGCYVAAYIAAGNDVKVGDKIDVPGIGSVEVMANNCLNPDDTTADTNNGVVLLPERAIFNAETMNNYDF